MRSAPSDPGAAATARAAALGFLAALALDPASASPASRPARPRGPAIVLSSADVGERTLETSDLRFVFFRRTYYQKHAPRSEEASGRRVQVEDRRKECRCLRLEDWSKVKFKSLRQIEILYPPGERAARLRLTERAGAVREIRADGLFGGGGPATPFFAAMVEGAEREFPLVLGDDPRDEWPAERLVRILLVRLPPPPPRRR